MPTYYTPGYFETSFNRSVPNPFPNAVLNAVRYDRDMTGMILAAALKDYAATARKFYAWADDGNYVYNFPTVHYCTLVGGGNDDALKNHLATRYGIDVANFTIASSSLAAFDAVDATNFCKALWTVKLNALNEGIVEDGIESQVDFHQSGSHEIKRDRTREWGGDFATATTFPTYTHFEFEPATAHNNSTLATTFNFRIRKVHTNYDTQPPSVVNDVWTYHYSPATGNYMKPVAGDTVWEVQWYYNDAPRQLHYDIINTEQSTESGLDLLAPSSGCNTFGDYYPIIPIYLYHNWYDYDATPAGVSYSDNIKDTYTQLGLGTLDSLKDQIASNGDIADVSNMYISLATNVYDTGSGSECYMYYWLKNILDNFPFVDTRTITDETNRITIREAGFNRNLLFQFIEEVSHVAYDPKVKYEYQLSWGSAIENNEHTGIWALDQGYTATTTYTGSIDAEDFYILPHKRARRKIVLSRILPASLGGGIAGSISIWGLQEQHLIRIIAGDPAHKFVDVFIDAPQQTEWATWQQYLIDHQDDVPVPDYTGEQPVGILLPFSKSVEDLIPTVAKKEFAECLYRSPHLHIYGVAVTKVHWTKKFVKDLIHLISIMATAYMIIATGGAFATAFTTGGLAAINTLIYDMAMDYIMDTVTQIIVDEIMEEYVMPMIADAMGMDDIGDIDIKSEEETILIDALSTLDNMPAIIDKVEGRLADKVQQDFENGGDSTETYVKVHSTTVAENTESFIKRTLTVKVEGMVVDQLKSVSQPPSLGIISPIGKNLKVKE